MSVTVEYRSYTAEALDGICRLIERDLSEPYSIFTYHYFVHEYPHLCRTAWVEDELVGVIIGRISVHREARRGYIGMLAVSSHHRGSTLVRHLVEIMIREGVDEVVLETEVSNTTALKLYGKLGFIREKRLANYYLNGSDAFRLKLWTVE